jgi:hypothetical protein
LENAQAPHGLNQNAMSRDHRILVLATLPGIAPPTGAVSPVLMVKP